MTQMSKLAPELEELGHDVRVCGPDDLNLDGVDVVHAQGITAKQVALCHRSGLPVVLSPVYWPTSYRVESSPFQGLGQRGRSGIGAARAAWNGTLFRTARRGSRRAYTTALAAEAADHLLPNARGELDALVDDLGVTTSATVVPNAADPSTFDIGPVDKARADSVVCVGRIEPHKNQLALIDATRMLDVKLKIVGEPHPHHASYYDQCLRAARNADVEFVGWRRLDELAAILATSAVHTLPSWFETTGLVSLEAALAGAKIVSTSRGYAHEYLEEDAWYCDPASVRDIARALSEALVSPWRPQLRARILHKYTWKSAALATVDGYRAALSL